MIRVFNKNHLYVFTNKKFMKDEIVRNDDNREIIKEWGRRCNGGVVKVLSPNLGIVRGTYVAPEWCKCIKQNYKKEK